MTPTPPPRDADAPAAWSYLAAADPAPAGSALSRDSLADRARQALLDLIDDEHLAAGDALPSTGVLAERFAVSRTVIREALSALAALGIVEISNGRSATVRAPDPSLVRFYLARALRESPGGGVAALMDLRAPLEARAARLAATQLSGGDREADRGALQRLLAQMGDVLADSAQYPQLDLVLHQEIARLSGNGGLLGILEAVRLPLFRAMQDLRAMRDTEGLVGAEHREHTRIVDALLAGDPDAAERAMDDHMRAITALIPAPVPPATRPSRSSTNSPDTSDTTPTKGD